MPNDQLDDELARTMRYWLARTLRALREQQAVTQQDIAYWADVDLATISNFERNRSWPREIDRIVAAYAQLTGQQDGRELWGQALKEWKGRGGVPTLGELSAPKRAQLRAVDAALRTAESRDESQSEPSATQKPSAARRSQ